VIHKETSRRSPSLAARFTRPRSTERLTRSTALLCLICSRSATAAIVRRSPGLVLLRLDTRCAGRGLAEGQETANAVAQLRKGAIGGGPDRSWLGHADLYRGTI
jgi:hypothetical protein